MTKCANAGPAIITASLDVSPSRTLPDRCAPGKRRCWLGIAPAITVAASLCAFAPVRSDAAVLIVGAPSPASVSENAGYGGIVSIPVTLSPEAGDGPSCIVSGTAVVSGGTATEGVDFSLTGAFSVGVSPGQAGTDTVEVAPIDDAVAEPTEQVSVQVLDANISLGPNCLGLDGVTPTPVSIVQGIATVSITDDDTDVDDPVVTPPADVTTEATGATTPAALGSATVTDNVDTGLTATADNTGPYSLGTTTVTWTATDSAGNVGTATQTVTITDTTGPTVTAPAAVTSEATGPTTTVTLGTATATDLVDGTVTDIVADNTGPFPVGATTVTWTATDAAGNPGTATQIVTVTDTTGPTVAAPADITAAATGATTPVDLGTATATDLVDGTVTDIVADNTGPFPVGATTVTWTATDAAGNPGTATQIVTIQDAAMPVVTPPADVVTEATGPTTPVTLGTATATDDIDGTLVPTADNTGPFAVGETIVTWSATDSQGNVGTAAQRVTVTDATAPTVTAPAAITTPATGATTPVTLGDATATDLVDGALTPTADNTGPFSIGVTTVTWSVTDAAGNVGTATQSVTVTDASMPVITGTVTLSGAPGSTVSTLLNVSDDQAPLIASAESGTVSPTTIDGSSGTVTYSRLIPAGTAANTTLTDTVTITDPAGNAAIANLTISVADGSAPTLPSDLTIPGGSPGGTVSEAFTVSDDQPGITISADLGTVDPVFIAGTSGDVTYTLALPATAVVGDIVNDVITITDAAGNASSLSVEVAVEPGFEQPGLTEKQQTIARSLDSACAAVGSGTGSSPGETNLAQTCASLPATASSLDMLAPDEFTSQGTLAVKAGAAQTTNVGARMTALRGGASGFSVAGLQLSVFGETLPQVLLTELASYGQNKGGGASGDESGLASKWGAFVNGDIRFGDKDPTSNEPGFDVNTKGVTLGLDYRLRNDLIVGAAAGYAHTDTDIDGNNGSVNVKTYTGSLYGSYYYSERTYVDAIVSFSRNSYDTERRFNNEDVDGDTDGWQYALSLGAGYDFTRDAFTFGPYGRIEYFRVRIDDFQEDPTAAGIELDIEDQTVKSLTTALGGQVSYSFSTDIGVVTPQLRVEWEHEFKDDSRTIDGTFVNDPTNTRFSVPTDNPDRDYFNVGAGVSATFAAGKSGFIYYEGQLGRTDFSEHSFTAGVRIDF